MESLINKTRGEGHGRKETIRLNMKRSIFQLNININALIRHAEG
jgi:hypothetical protein